MLLGLLLPLALVYALNGRALFARGDAIALVYGTGMHNLSIALAIAMGVFSHQGADAALLLALACVVQVQAGAWHLRWTDRLFGAPRQGTGP